MQISALNVVPLLLGALEGREDTQNGGSERSPLKNNDIFKIMRCNLDLDSTKSLMKISS